VSLILGKYEAIGRIAVGGMGEVFLARQRGVERLVILKSLLPGIDDEASMRDRFVDEARLVARLSHPNVVSVLEAGSTDGTLYLAMEYVPGWNLAQLQKALGEGGALSFEEIALVVSEAAAGLAHAHQHGIVHRDVSPQNIMVRRDGLTKVVDFGVARGAGRSTRTRTGLVVGKVGYMAPEQALGETTDPSSDQFSLGIVLWELLARQPLFDGTDAQIARALLDDPIPAPSTVRGDVPVELDALVMRMLDRRREARLPGCDVVATTLERMVQGGTTQRRAQLEARLSALGAVPAERKIESAPTQLATAPPDATRRLNPGSRRRLWILRGLLAVLAAIVALIFIIPRLPQKDLPWRSPLNPRLPALPLPTARPMTADLGPGPDGYPTQVIDPVGMQALLRAGKFELLTQIIEQTQAEAVADIHKEAWQMWSVAAFEQPQRAAQLHPEMDREAPEARRLLQLQADRAQLQEWVKQYGEYSFAPWAALGSFEQDPTTAAAALKRALALEPKFWPARMRLWELQGAEEQYQEALKLEPRLFFIRAARLEHLAEQGKTEGLAELTANLAVEDNPRLKGLLDGGAFFACDKARGDKDDWKIIELCSVAVARLAHWTPHTAMALAFVRLGQADEALAAADQALRLNPMWQEALVARMRALIALKRLDEAYVVAERIVRLGPEDDWTDKAVFNFVRQLLYRGQALEEGGKPEDAEHWFELCLALVKDEVHCNYRMGTTQEALGEHVAAKEYVRAALEVDTTMLGVRSQVQGMRENNRPAAAVGLWSLIIDAKPDEPRGYEGRGVAYRYLQRETEAHRDFQKSCDMGWKRACGLVNP
jgi:serine/threonine protein kinase/tetratricopeptide (TPR) repeat protein